MTVCDPRVVFQMLSFVETVLLFSRLGVDTNFVTSNKVYIHHLLYAAWLACMITIQAFDGPHKVLLLHGPPGVGKTSVVRALAQKVSTDFETFSEVDTSLFTT